MGDRSKRAKPEAVEQPPRKARVTRDRSQSLTTKLGQAKEKMLAKQFVAFCSRLKLPVPMLEQTFHPSRGFRFDFCWPECYVALESNGGLFTSGRHTRGAALLVEYEKLNAAAVLGWRVLFTTPDLLCDLSTLRTVGRAMGIELPEIGAIR